MERATRSFAACVASSKPSKATIAKGVYVGSFVRLDSSTRHILLKVMAVEGQGEQMRARAFHRPLLPSLPCVFLTTGRIDVQHRSKISIGD